MFSLSESVSSKRHACLVSDFKLPIGGNVSVLGCLPLNVSPVMICQILQGIPRNIIHIFLKMGNETEGKKILGYLLFRIVSHI